jgi:hypothetical protein
VEQSRTHRAAQSRESTSLKWCRLELQLLCNDYSNIIVLYI